MKRFVLTTATAALVAGASTLPALSAAHADLSSMTCADFRALDHEQQLEVSAMAIAELDGGGESLRDDATAGDSSSEGAATTEEEADDAADTTAVENEGTATATEGTDSADQKSVAEADMEALMASCDRNLDAMVLEAAAGMDTQR